jgi:uroporphyrinogen decarboxylase
MMTSRERVLLTLEHREADRVPIDIGSTANNFTKGLFNKLTAHFNIKSANLIPRPDESAPYYNDDLYEALGGDFRHVFLYPPSTADFNVRPDGTTVSEWGIVKREVNGLMQQSGYPLEDAETVEDIEKHPWPDPDNEARYRGLRERAKYLYEETSYAVAARAPWHGIFELSWETRRMENFFIDMATGDEKADRILDIITDIQVRMYTNYLKECGEYVHIVQTADDYGTQNGSILSLEMWRKYIKPRRRRINETIRKYAPNAKIFLHCCGSVREFIDDFIEIGVDVLNPIQPYAKDMDSANLKKRFGSRISFHGGIDEQRAFSKGQAAIDAELKARIHDMGPGGGYIIGPTSNIQDDTPLEDVLFYLEKAKEYGRYPINV